MFASSHSAVECLNSIQKILIRFIILHSFLSSLNHSNVILIKIYFNDKTLMLDSIE